MRIANPQSPNRLGRFFTADCKSAETPNGINHEKKLPMKKETWKTVFQIVISILTAIAASLGVTSCMS